MIKFSIIVSGILAIFLVVSCSEQRVAVKQTRDDINFSVTMNLVEPKELTELCTKLGVKYDADGCAAFNLDTKHCTIYVSPQRYTYDTERLALIGHEIWHCRFGLWHD